MQEPTEKSIEEKITASLAKWAPTAKAIGEALSDQGQSRWLRAAYVFCGIGAFGAASVTWATREINLAGIAIVSVPCFGLAIAAFLKAYRHGPNQDTPESADSETRPGSSQ